MISRRQWPKLSPIIVLCCLGFLLGTCGKKAPPEPPKKKKLSQVKDLQAVVVPAGVRLTWTIGSPDKDLAGFNVYRSKLQPEIRDCPGCTRDFELITTIKVEAGESRFEVTDSHVEGRGRIYYKVAPFDKQDRAGPDSNEIRVHVE